MFSHLVFAVALALFIAHFLDSRIRREHVLAAFAASAAAAGAEVLMAESETCKTVAKVTETTTVCTVEYTVNPAAFALLIASSALAFLTLVLLGVFKVAELWST